MYHTDEIRMADAVACGIVPFIETGIAEIRAAKSSVLDCEHLSGRRVNAA
jgi:hypothetical protein